MSISDIRSSQKPPSRRDKILDETLKIVGNCGYRGLSVKDVAACCGLTKQGVMHYFPSKDLLLLALLNERDASIEADLLALLASGGFEKADDPARKRAIFRESLVRLVGHMLETPDFVRLHVVLRAEAINADHPAKHYFVQRDASTLAWIAERVAPFCSRPASTARRIMAMMAGLQAQWLQEEQGFDLLAEWREALADMLP